MKMAICFLAIIACFCQPAFAGVTRTCNDLRKNLSPKKSLDFYQLELKKLQLEIQKKCSQCRKCTKEQLAFCKSVTTSEKNGVLFWLTLLVIGAVFFYLLLGRPTIDK